ncbi:MAG: hypothetical protein HY815_02565 [Candidatus Riflebacteria bacterium]|nr:hypothetical protein [Candidatus Riflebacteria bacterium]
MPRIWLGNVEEVFVPRGPGDDRILESKGSTLAPRLLLYAEPGDAFVLSCGVAPEFGRYVQEIAGLDEPPRVLFPSRLTSPYYLVDSTLEDRRLMDELGALVAGGDWSIEPQIETQRTWHLGDALGIPGGRTPRRDVSSGLVDRLNDKGRFKELAGQVGVPVVPGRCCSDDAAIRSAIDDLAREIPGDLMLRKVLSGGGLALECNLRHNGLSHILDFKRRYFGSAAAPAQVLYLENQRIGRDGVGLGELLERLARVRLDGEPAIIRQPGRSGGLVVVVPPHGRRCGLALFGPDQESVTAMHRQVNAALT